MRAAHKKYLIATVACLMVTPVFSQGPQQETPRTQQQPAAQQQGADQTLLVIEIKQPAQAQNKSEANTPERPKERSQSWLASWGLSDKIAAIASAEATRLTRARSRSTSRRAVRRSSAMTWAGRPPRTEETGRRLCTVTSAAAARRKLA
jgi:hypothetical protein